MPIIKEVPPPCKCPNKPNPANYGRGTIWECEKCEDRYKLEGGDYREPGNYWVRLYTKKTFNQKD